MTNYGFTSCGYSAVSQNSGITERFDDLANTQTARAVAAARQGPAGYFLNNYGFTCGGYTVAALGTNQRFDDVTNVHTLRTNITARYNAGGFSFNNYGFTSGGSDGAGKTERFDDIANTQTARANGTAAQRIAAYSFNNYGFTSCGGYPAIATTIRFNDITNSWTVRAGATARQSPAGYSFNNYGFSTCGETTGFVALGTTQRFDDTTNVHTARLDAIARARLAGYSFNNYGFSSCGINVGTTQRFDDTANTHTLRTAATARYLVTGYAILPSGGVAPVPPTPANIVATSITSDQSTCTDPCMPFVTVTWTNNGGTLGMFTPGILIDSTTSMTLPSRSLDIGTSYTGAFSPRLTVGTHSICPMLNNNNIACKTVTVIAQVLPANITAISMSIGAIIYGIPYSSVDVTIMWVNNGGSSGAFDPGVSIDEYTTTIEYGVTVPASTTLSRTIRIGGLTLGSHTICPDPN